ncbi:putative orotidine 5`-phosphate decarboxylase [Testicularia cyperi]|uniref:Orotidine 5'-phosphate decarboxylase n=1 Tax=Testicularia cyperi TaxID=1882483 RepID=A0A317XLJ4_9BASI|nr:putative orotidine 5`-phosphate decarboxylase [Testicularia cyperi]
MSSITLKTYASRAVNQPNAAAKALLECIERKQSNLCVSVDVTNKQDLLDVCDAVGPDVCLIKTHIDIVEDFDLDLVSQLTELSKKHDFLIFEDRKFADIGNTVSLQYSSGVHKISSWSHITNAHLVPGPGIITGLAKVGMPLGRGLLLLAEMSSAGALTKGSYTQACVEEAKKDTTGFVCGFIAMSRVDETEGPNTDRDLLILTPGVGLDVKGDAMGQQYRTPDQVIRESGCDVIIVGRGVYGALMTEEGKQDKKSAFAKVREQGLRYKRAGWEAYLARIGQKA